MLIAGMIKNADGGKDISMKNAFLEYIESEVKTEVESAFMPMLSFAQSNGEGTLQRVIARQIEEMVPLFHFGQNISGTQTLEAQEMTMEMILKEEAKEGDVGGNESTEEISGATLEAMLQAENQAAREQIAVQQQADASVSDTTFMPHTTKLAQVDMSTLADYETLLSTFYTVDKSTMIGSDQLNVAKLSQADMTVSKDAQGPQVLIYHTHSQEAFADSIPGDRDTSIVGVGDYLAQILTDTYGYQVLHHDAAYDLPSRDDAYSVALPEIEKLLEENPQIQVVIDLHRDAVDESTRLVTDIDGRPTARFMFFNGLSRTRKTGNISYLYNENLEGNLAFSFQMQKIAMEYYPGLTRKIYLKAYRYNMHLRPRNLLVELGAQNNTVEEAMNACEPLAHILDMVLSGQG